MVINGKNIADYDHPFNTTIINDNSAIPSTNTTIPERVNYMCVFIGGKGRDNKLIKKTSKADFVKEYGKPNALLYGQPILNAYASIVDQYSHAYCMRVMPNDACYSNLIVMAKFKKTPENLEIKLVTKNIANLKNSNQFASLVEQETDLTEDFNGYKTVPLFGIRSLGRGKYGNSFRIRLTNVFTKKKNIPYRTYKLEILDVEEGNTVVETFEGCLYDQSVNSRSLILSDVLDGDHTNSELAGMYVNENAFEEIYKVYYSLFTGIEETAPTLKLFDPIFGVANDKTKHPKLTIVTEGEGVVAIDRLDGVSLAGGNDGSLEGPEEGNVDEVIEDLYIKAFSGQLDKAILSSRRIPVKFILDANYPVNVKRQLVQLGLKRYDAIIHLDAGLITNHDEAKLFGEETSDLNYRIVSKSYQHYEIRDPFTGKRTPVTMTYDLATNLAKHIETYGLATPYTGETYATLKGAIKGSLMPVLDEFDEDLKESLYDLKLNYYEAVAENVYARATQQTAQEEASDLSEETNMLIVLEIKDIAEKETIARRYNFAEPSDRHLFTEVLNERIKPIKDIVRSVDVLYDMSSEEEARSTIHCYIEVTFKTLAKSSIVEINVNKRV